MTAGLDQRERLAEEVFASLDVPAESVRLLVSALRLSGGWIGAFAGPFDYHADAVEHGFDGALARLSMARVLRRIVSFHPGCDELIDRLEGVDEAPWPAIRAALIEIREQEVKR
jgi:hypothetical protein